VVIATANGLVQQVNAGNLKPLVTLAQKRSMSFPEIPCMKDMGYEEIDFNIWKFLLAPKGTPDEIVKYLYNNFKKILEDPVFIDSMNKMEMEIGYLSGREVESKLNKEYELVGSMLKELGFLK
jgi:tripartite-type tricarboxylate transporter receptor subunit TctC